MFDALLRRVIDPPLNAAGKAVARAGIGADAVTLAGFAVGMAALPLLAFGHFVPALAAILLNRLCDGLDGAVARATGSTDRGGYLDIVCDFVFYAAVPLGFALADAAYAVAAAFLIFSFVGTGSTFLAFAIMAAKRGMTSTLRGRKAFFYLGGLAEGTETIGFFVIVCLQPDWFPAAALVFALLCLLTAAGRGVAGWRVFSGPQR